MIENLDANQELFPYVVPEHRVPWLIPFISMLETSLGSERPSGSLAGGALPELDLSSANDNGSLNSPVPMQKLLPDANHVNLTRQLPLRTSFFNESAINFVDIVQFKQSEGEMRENQQRLELANEELNDLVAGQTEQIRQLASEVLLTGHKVRTAISQLLHDDLQQILVSMKLKILSIEQLQPIDEHSLQAQIQELSEATNLAIAVTRRVASDLKPPILSNKNFMALIQWLVKVMNKQYGLVVEVKGTVRPSWLKEEVSSFLFQTLRELLFNVVKHAGVKVVLVEVSEVNDQLSIAVSDSGEGFDAAATMQQPSSLGLFNICRQLELFGGQFQIESQPGLGTRAVVVVRR